jgi:hypothetical protein
MTTPRRDGLYTVVIPVFAAIVAGLALTALYGGAYPGSHAELYARYAANLRAGSGLIFGSDSRSLLEFSPLYMGFLAILSAKIVFIAALVVAAVSVTSIAQRAGLSQRDALSAMLLTILAWPLAMGIETPYPLTGALCLLAIALAIQDRPTLAGLATFGAGLCTPVALWLILPLLIFLAGRGGIGRYVLGSLVPLILVLILCSAYYGEDFWTGLALLKPVSAANLIAAIAWALTLIFLYFAVQGWYSARQNPIVGLCALWVVLYGVIEGMIFRVDNGWVYAPIAGALSVLVIFGLVSARGMIKLPLDIILILYAGYTAYSLVSFVPQVNTLPAAPSTIGLVSGTSLERWQLPAASTITAFDGAFQPDLNRSVERGDLASALAHYAPDIILPDPNFSISDLKATQNWRRLGYQQNETGAWIRTRSVGAGFTTQPLDIAFGPDLRLQGIAFDRDGATAGDVIRVRLDWAIAHSTSQNITLALRLEDGDWVYASVDDTFEQQVFASGTYSTYHVLTLDQNAPAARYDLSVGVLVGDGYIKRAPVAQFDVKAP